MAAIHNNGYSGKRNLESDASAYEYTAGMSKENPIINSALSCFLLFLINNIIPNGTKKIR